MFLIAEILLTIFAWRNGWKWLSLLPVGIAMVIGLIVGMGIGASGGSVDAVKGFVVIFDILAIIALIVMVSKKPKDKTELPTELK